MKETIANATEASQASTIIELKQAAMPNAPTTAEDVFKGTRPNIVTPDATTQNALSPETLKEHAAGEVSQVKIPMVNTFEDQFVSQYLPRVFPWALPFDCGGPDMPHLFAPKGVDGEAEENALDRSVTTRWRRKENEAKLLPGPYAKMLAARSEAQIGADWMLVPAARNLHWRWQVLRSAFLECKKKVSPGHDMSENLHSLIEAVKSIWKRMLKDTIIVNGEKKQLNGDTSKVWLADDISKDEKIILGAYTKTTRNIAGCQQLRPTIGKILFGMRVFYGEPIFVTISPNRRHSSLLLKLSRKRANDPFLRKLSLIHI